MPRSDPFWYCHQCNVEMRPSTMTPHPLCSSCGSDFIEQLPGDDEPNATDDPRAFNAMARLFNNNDEPHPHGVGAAVDPVGQLLGAMLGMRNIGSGAETPPARGSPGSGGPTISIRRGNGESGTRGRSNSGSGGLHFSFRSGSGSGSGSGGSGGGFGVFSSFGGGRQEREREGERRGDRGRDDVPTPEELISAIFPGAQTPEQGRGAPSPMLHNMLMGLFGAGIGNPGVGMGAHGDGRWGDYALNQEALDRIMTQLMEGSNPAPIPAPEDMIASWPRTILTPGNTLEHEGCAVCKEPFTYVPPEADQASSSTEQENPQPQEALTLPCRHSFHVECIEPWVKVKGTCPVCRFELVSQDRRSGEQNRGDEGGGGGSGSSGSRQERPGGRRRPSERAGGRRDSPLPPGGYLD